MTDKDTITLPREVVVQTVRVLSKFYDTWPRERKEAVAALRTHLAAPRAEPDDSIPLHQSDCALLIGGYQCTCGFRQRQNKTPTALAAEQPKHPGYIIGSHWLETAYSRVCAGEAEADVLRDCGWERVDDIESLRRNAERWQWVRVWFRREFEGRNGDFGGTLEDFDAAIDAAMGEKR